MRISMFWGLVSIFLFVEKIIDDSGSEGMKKGSFWLPSTSYSELYFLKFSACSNISLNTSSLVTGG